MLCEVTSTEIWRKWQFSTEIYFWYNKTIVDFCCSKHYTIVDFCWCGHEVLLNSKLHIDQHNMSCLLFNNTSYSPKQKSTIVLLYSKGIFQLKGPSFTPDFSWHYFTNHATLGHRLCDITWNDITIHAISGSQLMQHYTIIDYWGIGHDVMLTREYQYWPRL